MTYDLLIQNIKELILPVTTERPLKGKDLDELNVVKHGTVVVHEGKLSMQGLILKTTKHATQLMLLTALFHPRLLTHTHI